MLKFSGFADLTSCLVQIDAMIVSVAQICARDKCAGNAQCVPCSKCTAAFNASAVAARADAQTRAETAAQAHDTNETLK